MLNMLRVVADTNIYISVIIFGGKTELIRKLAKNKKIKLPISEDILAEIAGILKRKFNWPDLKIEHTIDSLKTITTLVTPKHTLKIVRNHDPDNRILECALEGGAQYIVSGDKHHLLPLKEYQRIKILSLTEFTKEMQLKGVRHHIGFLEII